MLSATATLQTPNKNASTQAETVIVIKQW